MNSIYKKIYNLVSLLFCFFTIYEFIIYLLNESNFYGLYYLLVEIFIIFMIIGVNFNYIKGNKKIRFSKSIVIFLFTIFSSFILFNILKSNYNYIDYSSSYIKSIWFSSKIIKPLLTFILTLISFLDYKQVNISNYKINNHNK